MDTYRGPMTTCLPAGNLISCIWSDTQIQICWMYRQKEVYFRLYFPHCRKMMDLVKSSLQLYCDNRVTELYYNNDKSSARSRHIDIKFLVVKDRVGTTLCLLTVLVLVLTLLIHSLKDCLLKYS